MRLQFVHIWILSLAWIIPLVAVWWINVGRATGRNMAAFVSPIMQRKLMTAQSTARFFWQTGLVLSALLLMLIAAAQPQWGIKEEIVYQRGRDVLVAIDVSRSMLANDVHPNRLRRAKADIIDLISELKGDRAGLIVFRHKASLLCPLTTDYAFLRQTLDSIDTDSAPAGPTDIGDAITKALESFDNRDSSHKAIVLVSDGEDLQENALNAAEEAKKRGIPVFAVGLGSRRGSRIPDSETHGGFTLYKGDEVISKLNDEALDTIAKISGGVYIPVGTASTSTTTLGTLYRSLQQRVGAQDFEEVRLRRRVERYQLFLFPALLILLAAATFSRGRLLTGSRLSTNNQASDKKTEATTGNLRNLTPPSQPVKMLSILIAVSFLMNTVSAETNSTSKTKLSPQPSQTPPGRAGARIAQKQYAMGAFDKAAQTYMEAARGSTVKSQRDFRYNAAVALLKAQKFKEAADILQALVNENQPNQGDEYRAMGLALYMYAMTSTNTAADGLNEVAHNMRKAGESFREAITAHDDTETRANLAAIIAKLPEIEQRAKISALLAEHENANAFQIADVMLSRQRDIVTSLKSTITNDTPSYVYDMEALAASQHDNADLWIPLKKKLLDAVAQQPNSTNLQQTLASVEQMTEMTRDKMLNASENMRDLDTMAYTDAYDSSEIIYGFWKHIAPYAALLEEDITRQSNAITHTHANNSSSFKELLANQEEALALSRLFADRFAQTVPETNAAPTAISTNNTENAEQITIEDRRKVLDLSTQAIATQEDAIRFLRDSNIEKALIAERDSHGILLEIRKLLPKDKSAQHDQNTESQQQQQEQNNESRQQQEFQQDAQQPQDTQQQEPQSQEPKEKPLPEDVKKMLEKALQREKEHEAEKRRRMNVPRIPNERDW
ncbi:MAG: VWA domain-containing protein [Lentisphaerae bacterium]|nr:VWA domain-containing protein [Lentisphaerota bacterium]